MLRLTRARWHIDADTPREAIEFIALAEEIDGSPNPLPPVPLPRERPSSPAPRLGPVRSSADADADWSVADAREYLESATVAGRQVIRALVSLNDAVQVADLARRAYVVMRSAGVVLAKLRRDAACFWRDKRPPIKRRRIDKREHVVAEPSFRAAMLVVFAALRRSP